MPTEAGATATAQRRNLLSSPVHGAHVMGGHNLP